MIGEIGARKFRVIDYDPAIDQAYCVYIDCPDQDFYLDNPHDHIIAPE